MARLMKRRGSGRGRGRGRGRGGRDRGKCRFGGDTSKIDYKDIALLSKFTTNQGKVFSRKRSGCSARCQRALCKAIKRARFLGLLPYAG